jgi:hypothetical protein
VIVTSRLTIFTLKHPFKHFVEFSLNIARCIILNHISTHLTLSVQNNVSKFAKVFTDNLSVILVIKENLLCETNENLGILKEFFDKWIENPIIEMFALTQPTFARETQGRIILFQEVQYIMKGTISSVSRVFLVEGTILRVKLGCKIPEY